MKAKAKYADLKERGEEAVGDDVLEFMDSLLTPEEIAESNLRVALIGELIKARQERNQPEEAGRTKRSKAACYCADGKRCNQSED